MQAHGHDDLHLLHHTDDELFIARRRQHRAGKRQLACDFPAGRQIPSWLEREENRREAIRFLYVFCAFHERLLLFRKARPVTQDEERIASGGVHVVAEQKSVDCALQSRLQKQRRVRRHIDLRLRHAHGTKLLGRKVLSQCDRIDVPVDDARGALSAGFSIYGTDAAAVHQNAISGKLCKADAEKVIVEASRARLVLNEAAAAGDIELRAAHDGKEREGIEDIGRAHMVREPCRFRIVREHADGHVGVDVLELAQNGLQNRLIARIALAIRPADRHAAALFLWPLRLPQDRSVNVQLVMDGRFGGVHPLRLFIEVLPKLPAKRRILDEPHHVGGQGIHVSWRKKKPRHAGLHHIGDAADGRRNRRAAHSRALHQSIR